MCQPDGVNNNQKGGANDYWETGAAGEGYERGHILQANLTNINLAPGLTALLATSNSREEPLRYPQRLFHFAGLQRSLDRCELPTT